VKGAFLLVKMWCKRLTFFNSDGKKQAALKKF
jgi:hypothetical protein